MAITESIILFAGFVFAHAAWSVSDLPKDELLVPLVMIEKAGKRELIRFEADSQEQAITKAKAWIAANEASIDFWVFAREGQFKEKGKFVDVLTIEAKSRPMSDSIVFVQRFQPFHKGKFRLIGEPSVSIKGQIVNETEAKRLRKLLIDGVSTHPHASPLWKQWTMP
jgi:hypothetical protein